MVDYNEFKGLVHSNLKEDDGVVVGWDKATVRYVLDNKSKVLRFIRNHGRKLKYNITQMDIDDIYSVLLLHLHDSGDYDIERAFNYEEGRLLSLEGYINSCINNCCKRTLIAEYKHTKQNISESMYDEDGNEISLFDLTPDTVGSVKLDDIGYNLEEMCKTYECERYTLGVDIFQVIFIKLATMKHNKTDKYIEILDLLGTSKQELNSLTSKIQDGDAFTSIIKAASMINIEDALNILKKYTFCAERLEKTVIES